MFSLLAALDEEILEQIYELTYKYGWITQEERYSGWLTDRAYMAKYKIEDQLSTVLDYALEEMIDTYENWLAQHTKEGWVQSLYELGKDLGIEYVLFTLDRWGLSYKDKLYEAVEKGLGGSREMLNQEDETYLTEAYGTRFVPDYIAKLPEAAAEKAQEEYENLQEMHTEEEAAGEFIQRYDLVDELKDWLIEDIGWTGAEWLQDVYPVQDLMDSFEDIVLSELETLLDEAYPMYLRHFEHPGKVGGKSLEEEIADIQNMADKLKEGLNSTLSEKIILFQLGLTTGHHHGTMADHLLDVGAGSGKKFLDQLSAGPNVEEWDKDLEKVLGKPPSQIGVMPEELYVNPEERYLQSLKHSSALQIAASVGGALWYYTPYGKESSKTSYR
jgi:hypothetical protein